MYKKIVAFVAAIALICSFVPNAALALTANDENSFSVSNASVTVDGSNAQTVDIVFSGTANDTYAYFQGSFATKDSNGKVTLSNMTAGYDTDLSSYVAVNDGSFKFIDEENGLEAEAGVALVTATYTVPGDTPSGEYEVPVNLTTSCNFDDAQVKNATYTAKINVTNTSGGASSDGYAATIAGASTNDDPVRVGATNPIKVNIGTNLDFAATEMTITYPSSLVSFNEEASTLNNAAITENTNGTLTLAHYGETKTAAGDNYVLAFTVGSTAGNAEFKITEAGFGTEDAAVKDDLTAVASENLGSVSIEIKNALATLTLPDDGLFRADTTTVEVGGTFTFYPENENGAYYTYTTPTATYADGSAANVTEIKDEDGNVTGWQIVGVTGNVNIDAGQRSPKSYGDVTYTYNNANGATGCETDVTAKTTAAIYLTPISFTIPKDVTASTTDGVKYDVTATIGGVGHTFADPTVDSDTGARTYTIPGEAVKGAVTITVTKTKLDANKVTVSIGGNNSADGKFENQEAGTSIQIDKTTGSANLTVDTTTGLNKGYKYTVETSAGKLTLNEDGTYTITGLTENAIISIDRTLNVDNVKNKVTIDSKEKNFVTLNENNMWLIQLPNHVGNTTTAVYKYNGQNMFWSADHDNYVIVVISETEPDISADKFTLDTIASTPTIASNDWDVNKSGNTDANDAQLIWNMYSNVYQTIDTNADGATAEKFMLADANHDGVLDTKDATLIINKILNITANQI